MHVDIQLTKTDLSEIVRRYVARRLHFALGRFGSRVGLLSVRIAGYDGSPGARHLCRISAEMAPFGEVSVQESHPDFHLAIDRACGKIGRAFARELERLRDLRTTRETIRAA